MRYLGRVRSRTATAMCAQEPALIPERKLWRAVLGQACEDAETPVTQGEKVSQRKARLCARAYLRADISKEAAEMKLVCDFADIPFDRVMLWARQQYGREQTPEKRMECGSPAAAFAAGPILQSRKREPGSRTPQITA
jgi:hypothetical protein